MRMVLMLLAALTAGCGAADPEDRARAPSTSTTTAQVKRCVADDGVVEIAFEIPETTRAGERLWGKLTVRNIGDQTVWWQAGGGLPPAAAALTAPCARLARDGEWSGAPSDLVQSVPRGATELPFLDEQHVGLLTVARTASSEMSALDVGEVRTMAVAADVRLPASAPTTWVARAVARFYDDPSQYGGSGTVGARPDVVARCPIRIEALEVDASRAIEVFAAERRLRAFVADTEVDTVENSWDVHLAWWADAWELTVTPKYSSDPRGQSRYRLRYRTGDVIDARRIWWDQAPADDPGGTHFPGAPPDDVD